MRNERNSEPLVIKVYFLELLQTLLYGVAIIIGIIGFVIIVIAVLFYAMGEEIENWEKIEDERNSTNGDFTTGKQ